jgi:hypothetical protein
MSALFSTFIRILTASLFISGVVCCGANDVSRRIHPIPIAVHGFALSDSDQNITALDQWTQRVQEVTDLQIEVIGCASGYRLVTSQIDKIALYHSDRGCRIRLHAFQWNGEVFLSKDGPLEGRVGTAAMFRSKFRELQVIISAMIHDPVQEDDSIAYSMASKISRGADASVLKLNLGESARVKRRPAAIRIPHFNLEKASIIATLPETKSFGMSFDLECVHSIKHEKKPERRKCGAVRLRDTFYILVPDIYNGHPSIEQMECLFKIGALKVDPAEDYYELPSVKHHGGFRTSRRDVILRSPTNTANNPHMLLILKGHGGYQYFNLDFDTGKK